MIVTWMLYYYLFALCPIMIITCAFLFMQHPFIRPYAYGVLILLLTTVTFAVTIATVILLQLLVLYCYHYITVTTDKLCQVSFYSGVVELTTQLLRLINIIWAPLVSNQ